MAPRDIAVSVREFSKAARQLRTAARFFLRMVSVAVVLTVAVGALAQKSDHALDGTWVNVDAASRGLVMIEIAGNKIHPYGKCHPQLCDWGVIKAKVFTAGVNLGAAAALHAKTTTSFAASDIVVTLETDGRMRVEVFTHFTDASKRNDYRAVDYFVRGRQPYER